MGIFTFCCSTEGDTRCAAVASPDKSWSMSWYVDVNVGVGIAVGVGALVLELV